MNAAGPIPERHERVAGHFTGVADRVTDWDAPSPVPGWTARDVVMHLVMWIHDFLADGGVDLTRHIDGDDPLGTWHAHSGELQALLESPAADRDFTHPQAGTASLKETLDRFYTVDVLMHTWDLAEAAGLPSGLDPAECERLLDGMREIEPMLRESGQFGAAVPVPDDADGVTRLMAFIGRDPRWRDR